MAIRVRLLRSRQKDPVKARASARTTGSVLVLELIQATGQEQTETSVVAQDRLDVVVPAVVSPVVVEIQIMSGERLKSNRGRVYCRNLNRTTRRKRDEIK